MSTSYSIVVTTYSKEETGSRIIDALLSAKLAACVQVVPIRSFYTWKGKVLKDREKLMLIKARSGDFGKIRATILGNHDYELPEIISVRIDRGLAGYLRWIDGVTRRAGSRRHRTARPGKVLP
jgi:periplasmic divalent cation tolerance protein